MQTYQQELAQIISDPEVLQKEPFTLIFNTVIHKVEVAVKFVGPQAAIMENSFRSGDFVRVTGYMEDEHLMLTWITLDPINSTGRNISTYG